MKLTNLYSAILEKRQPRQISLKRIPVIRALRSLLGLFLLSTTMLIASSSNAHAYIDPGYGSLLWQLLIAGFFGSLFYTRNIIFKVKTWFRTRKRNQPRTD